MANPRPTIRIRRATPADTEAIMNVYFAGFASVKPTSLVYPGGGNASERAKFGARLFPPEASPGPGGQDTIPLPVETFVMVAELVPPPSAAGGEGEIVAVAKWRLVREATPRDEYAAYVEMTEETMGEGTNSRLYNAFSGGLHEFRRKWMAGVACLHLGTLTCHPAHRGLGAASALLRWGTELADAEGIPAFLESSPYAHALYRKHGFEDVDAQDLDLTGLFGTVRREGEDWGGNMAVAIAGELKEGFLRAAVMRRLPRVA